MSPRNTIPNLVSFQGVPFILNTLGHVLLSTSKLRVYGYLVGCSDFSFWGMKDFPLDPQKKGQQLNSHQRLQA